MTYIKLVLTCLGVYCGVLTVAVVSGGQGPGWGSGTLEELCSLLVGTSDPLINF